MISRTLARKTRTWKLKQFVPRFEQLETRALLTAAIPGVTLDPALVHKFVNALPLALDPSFVYKTTDTTTVTLENGKTAKVPLYHVGAAEITQDLLGTVDDVNNPGDTTTFQTNVYGYGPVDAQGNIHASYPGQSFEVTSGKAIAVDWVDGLTQETHLLPVDPTTLDTSDQGLASY